MATITLADSDGKPRRYSLPPPPPARARRITFRELRHTYGTQMAASGTPLLTLQGYMGHRDYKTTEVYAQFAPDPLEGRRLAEAAFGPSTKPSTKLSATEGNEGDPEPHR